MNKQEIIGKIGKENWPKFLKFMSGQTVGINKDGLHNYYESDVDNFIRDGPVLD